MTQTLNSLVGRRGELMAELFLRDLTPQDIINQTQSDFGYDYLLSFKNDKGGLNNFAVEVKSTQSDPGPFFALRTKTFERMLASNIPILLLIADVKDNRLAYAWPQDQRDALKSTLDSKLKITKITESSKQALKKKLIDSNSAVVPYFY